MSTLIGTLAGGRADDVDQPGVERVAGPGRELLGPALTDSGIRRVIRATPPSSSILVAGRRRGRRRGRGSGGAGARDHEVELATVEPDVDAARRHLGGDLGGRLGDGLHQREPGRRVEGEGQPLGGRLGLGAAGLGGREQVAAEAVDVGRDVHVHHDDIIVTSCQEKLVSRGVRAVSPAREWEGPGEIGAHNVDGLGSTQLQKGRPHVRDPSPRSRLR